jgi:hypothetical protein
VPKHTAEPADAWISQRQVWLAFQMPSVAVLVTVDRSAINGPGCSAGCAVVDQQWLLDQLVSVQHMWAIRWLNNLVLLFELAPAVQLVL